MSLVESHSAAVQAVACGIHAVPQSSSAFAVTQAAWRFFHNPRVTLPALAAPLVEFARGESNLHCQDYILAAHDWSQLMYPNHTGKKDRVMLSSNHVPEGYEILTTLLIGDREGLPIAPVEIGLRAADGVHCSRSEQVLAAVSPLDEILPVMEHVAQLSLSRPVVHIVDAEADSVDHYRQWSAAGKLFLVRADDHLVQHEGSEKRCSAIQKQMRRRGQLKFSRDVLYHGRKARQSVAEASVTLTRAGQRNRPGAGDRRKIPGPPLALRLIVSEVRDLKGKLLATWFLLTNVSSDVAAEQVALWYYWRWNIETFFKLLKSAGLEVEQWQQESADAIARRLWVACMACVSVWQLARNKEPVADEARRLLIRLSGRQMKWGVAFTMPALLAGMWMLLTMLETLEHYSPDELRALAAIALPQPPRNKPPDV